MNLKYAKTSSFGSWNLSHILSQLFADELTV